MIPSDFLFLRQARVAEDREEVRAKIRVAEDREEVQEHPYVSIVYMVLVMFANSCGAAEFPLHICASKPCNKGPTCQKKVTGVCRCLGCSAPEVSNRSGKAQGPNITIGGLEEAWRDNLSSVGWG